MRVDKVRIQNFQCIGDSGDISLDNSITILVGENESGKSAILKALSYFNQEKSFVDDDISTISSTKDQLDAGKLSPNNIEMVAIWVALSDKDRCELELPNLLSEFPTLKIVKMLNNQYLIFTDDSKPLSDAVAKIGCEKLNKCLEDLRKKLQDIYCGQVVEKRPKTIRVFLKREGDSPGDYILLRKNTAEYIWDDIQPGDSLQVTRISKVSSTNRRQAQNAGFQFDLENILLNFISSIRSDPSTILESFNVFKCQLEKLPLEHPLWDCLEEKFIDGIEDLCTDISLAPSEFEVIKNKILARIPNFMYVPDVEKISDIVALEKLSSSNLTESDRQLKRLIESTGLHPEDVIRKSYTGRMRIIKQKSASISKQLREHWFNSDIEVNYGFFNEDREIGITVDSCGSVDPPSRRSQGFISYISLFAKLVAIRDAVLLLDDPGMYLHPVAQRKLLTLLESQKYQIIIATHLPFMIDPYHLERVRVVKRTQAGSQVEREWEKAQQSLLPVWGSLMGNFIGKVWLLVEGKSDWKYYMSLSKACNDAGLEHLSSDIVVVPGGGSQLPYVAQVVNSRGIFFIALLDGDGAGLSIKQRVVDICAVDPARIITLDKVGIQEPSPTIEHLFSQEFKGKYNVGSRLDLSKAITDAESGSKTFDKTTLAAFEKVFSLVKDAIRQFL